MTPTRNTHPTWQSLTVFEPGLVGLADQAAANTDADDWHGWSAIKSQLTRLVGWAARNPKLQSSDAYDAAYQHLLSLWEGRL